MKHGSRTAIMVVWAGRHRRDEWTALSQRYLKRIRRMAVLEEHPVRVAGGRKGKERLADEGRPGSSDLGVTGH